MQDDLKFLLTFLTTIMNATKRNMPVAVHLGYSFRKDKPASGGGLYWRCRYPHCTARLFTNDDMEEPQARGHPHNHVSNPEAIVVQQRKTVMKSRA